MENVKSFFDYDSLMFFGRVNASISHELKNIMAIISETAGLLSDLAGMASTGTAVDRDMLKTSADSIMEEVERGFTTIRQMNRFSHSVDAPFVSTDLMALLDLVCHLSNYLAFSGKTHLVHWDGKPPSVHTCPLILQAIVYEILVQHFKQAGPNAELEVKVASQAESGWRIIFTGFSVSNFEVFPDDQLKKLADRIAVSIEGNPATEQLELQIPLTIQPGSGSGEATDWINGGETPSIGVETT
ncbi:MAG: hypothetical protein PVJ19_13185 [Desulfobacteraceae bacterium]|jgi:signal transduction histidine kinase